MKKIFIVLCLVLSLVLCSCGGYKPIEPDAEDLTVVGQVNGRDVYMEELRFVAYTYRHMMTARYGEDIFTGAEKEKYLEMLREVLKITNIYFSNHEDLTKRLQGILRRCRFFLIF